MVVGHTTRFVADNFAMPTKRMLDKLGILETSRSDLLVTHEGGFIKYFSFQGGVTGTPTDLIIIDDPYRNFEQAYSQLQREKIMQEYNWGIVGRLRDSELSKVSKILIMTPWHYDDIAHRLMAQKDVAGNPIWEVIKLPALAKEGDPLGRTVGDPLCPDLQSRTALEQKRADNPSMFNALFQLSPEIDGGNIFKRDWWKRYAELPTEFDFTLQAIDSAWETKKENDFSVCTTWGVKGADIYLIDMWRDKVEYPDLKDQLVALFNYHRPYIMLIENEQSGRGAIQELTRDTYLPIQAIKPEGSKEIRARAIATLVKNGRVWIPENAPWALDFLDETAAFPKGKHDDIVDTISMALQYIIYNSSDPITLI